MALRARFNISESENDSCCSLPVLQSAAGKADVCRGCPGRELCLSQGQYLRNRWKSLIAAHFIAKGGVDPDQKFIDVRMNAARRRIVVVSGKGGRLVGYM